MSEDKARLIEAASKLFIGVFVCLVLALQLWLSHQSSKDFNDKLERSINAQAAAIDRLVQRMEVFIKP